MEWRKLVGAWENQRCDEKREIHLKLKELANTIKQSDIDTREISDQMNVKTQDLDTPENKIEQRVKEKMDKAEGVEMQKVKALVKKPREIGEKE